MRPCWIRFGSNFGFRKLSVANKSTLSGRIKVCKTFIRRFDSDPRLQARQQNQAILALHI
jgi:hypothetical protein